MLSSIVQENAQTIQDIDGMIDALHVQIAELKESSLNDGELMDHVAKLEWELAEGRTANLAKLERVKEKRRQIESELEEKTAIVKELEEKVADITSKAQTCAARDNGAVAQQIRLLQTELQTQKDLNATLSEAKTELGKANSVILECEGRANDCKTKLSEAENKFLDVMEKKAAVDGELAAEKKRRESISEQLAEQQRDVDQLKKQHTAAIAAKETELSILKQQHTTALRNLQQSNSTVVTSNATKLNELKTELATTRSGLDSSNEANRQKEQTINTQIAELKALKEQIDSAEAENRAFIAANEGKISEIILESARQRALASKALADYKKALEGKRTAEGQLNSYKTEIERLKAAITKQQQGVVTSRINSAKKANVNAIINTDRNDLRRGTLVGCTMQAQSVTSFLEQLVNGGDDAKELTTKLTTRAAGLTSQSKTCKEQFDQIIEDLGALTTYKYIIEAHKKSTNIVPYYTSNCSYNKTFNMTARKIPSLLLALAQPRANLVFIGITPGIAYTRVRQYIGLLNSSNYNIQVISYHLEKNGNLEQQPTGHFKTMTQVESAAAGEFADFNQVLGISVSDSLGLNVQTFMIVCVRADNYRDPMYHQFSLSDSELTKIKEKIHGKEQLSWSMFIVGGEACKETIDFLRTPVNNANIS